MPEAGDRAYNISAPWGFHGKNMVLHFEGYYSGRTTISKFDYDLDVYTIPTRPGSSGSPVYNGQWEIVGIASMANMRLENFGLMVTLEDIQEFLKDLWDT